jgi:hypothetical protein
MIGWIGRINRYCFADLLTQGACKHTNRKCTFVVIDDGAVPEVTLAAGRYLMSCRRMGRGAQ